MEEFNSQQNEAPISVGDWVVTILVTALPIIGIVMLFVWGFGGDRKRLLIFGEGTKWNETLFCASLFLH